MADQENTELTVAASMAPPSERVISNDVTNDTTTTSDTPAKGDASATDARKRDASSSEVATASEAKTRDNVVHTVSKDAREERHVTYDRSVDLLEREKETRITKVGDEDDPVAYKAIFRDEMHRLHRELEKFKEQVAKEYERNEKRLVKQKRLLEEEMAGLERQREEAKSRLTEAPLVDVECLAQEEQLLKRRQYLLDQEMQLLDREDRLSASQRRLEEYEAEIQDIEGYLDRRMEISRRRESELVELDQELRDVESLQRTSTSQEMPPRDVHNEIGGSMGPSSPQTPDCNLPEVFVEEPPPRSWETERTSLQERQSQLELMLKKAKGDLASATNSNQSLEAKIVDLERSLRRSEKRVRELESQLALNMTLVPSGLSNARRLPALRDADNQQQQQNGEDYSVSSMASHSTANHNAPAQSESPTPVRFSVRLKASPPSLSPSSSMTSALAKTALMKKVSGQSPVSAQVAPEVDRPALAWQRHEHQRRGLGPTAATSASVVPPSPNKRRLSSASEQLPGGPTLAARPGGRHADNLSLRSDSRVCVLQ